MPGVVSFGCGYSIEGIRVMDAREQSDTMVEQSKQTNPSTDRAARWKPIPPFPSLRFYLLKALTLFGLVGIPAGLLTSVQLALSVAMDLKNKILPFWYYSPIAIEIPWLFFTLLAVFAIATSPWAIALLIRTHHPISTMTTSRLAQYSPEAHRILQHIAQESAIPLPTLVLIDSPLPIALSYGFAPQFATIAVSQGTLTALNESEIAALYAQEFAHIAHWTTPLLSGSVVLQAMPYLAYIAASRLGDRMAFQSKRSFRFAIFGGLLKAIANLCGLAASGFYGVYCGVRWTGLWLSRSRTYYSDRIVCNGTGNPNGLVKVLLKLTQATRKAIVANGFTPMDLELLEPLLPINLDESISTRKVKSIGAVEIDRWWEINQSQIPISVRFSRLMVTARSWQIKPLFKRSEQPWNWTPSASVRTWAKPWFWAVIGYGVAWVLWGTGWVTYLFGWNRLAWLGSDYDLFLGLPLLGFGLGTFVRFNAFFPDLPALFLRADDRSSPPEYLITMNENDNGLRPEQVMLTGTLTGRSGIANWLAQDLWLMTDQGDYIALHVTSKTGPFGLGLARLLNQWSIAECIGQSIVVSGWLRQGVTPWIDAEAIRIGSRLIRSEHQFATVMTGAIGVAIGLYIAL